MTRRTLSKYLWSAARRQGDWEIGRQRSRYADLLHIGVLSWSRVASIRKSVCLHYQMFPTRTNKRTPNGKHNLYSPYPRQLHSWKSAFSTMYTSSSKETHCKRGTLLSWWTQKKSLYSAFKNSWYLHNCPLTETRRLEALLAPLVVLLVKLLQS